MLEFPSFSQSSPMSDVDGKFFYHLGEGLRRLGRPSEADSVYEAGAEAGKFISFWQRSLYNVGGLKVKNAAKKGVEFT